MDEQLIYRIAEEYILLYTPSAEATRELLPNYEPFLVPELPDGCEPLFTFRGGESLSSDQPKTLLEDKLSEGVRARVYKLIDGQRRLEIATRQVPTLSRSIVTGRRCAQMSCSMIPRHSSSSTA